jgi:hypothetical protein
MNFEIAAKLARVTLSAARASGTYEGADDTCIESILARQIDAAAALTVDPGERPDPQALKACLANRRPPVNMDAKQNPGVATCLAAVRSMSLPLRYTAAALPLGWGRAVTALDALADAYAEESQPAGQNNANVDYDDRATGSPFLLSFYGMLVQQVARTQLVASAN